MLEKISLNSPDLAGKLCGKFDENFDILRDRLEVALSFREGELHVSGAQARVELAVKVIKSLIDRAGEGAELTSGEVARVIGMWQRGEGAFVARLGKDVVAVTARGRRICPKTEGQSRYVKEIASNTVTLGIGPAGTGKTYLAVCAAVTAFKAGAFERIVLSRPAIEAGEKLGFLPGDLQEKVDPYLQPLYDALADLLGAEVYPKLIEKGAIIIAPLAYMRGRTLSSSFVILDEAQNTTVEQMKMFLTRLGDGSKMVVTGDITQIDLPPLQTSGLVHAKGILKGIEGISIVELQETDVVRHELVSKIIKAYENKKS